NKIAELFFDNEIVASHGFDCSHDAYIIKALSKVFLERMNKQPKECLFGDCGNHVCTVYKYLPALLSRDPKIIENACQQIINVLHNRFCNDFSKHDVCGINIIDFIDSLKKNAHHFERDKEIRPILSRFITDFSKLLSSSAYSSSNEATTKEASTSPK